MKAQAMTDNPVRTYAGDSKRGMRGCLATLLMVAASMFLSACSASKPVTTQTLTRNEGNFNRPLILSGNPDRDAAAYNSSEEQLSSADWQAVFDVLSHYVNPDQIGKVREAMPEEVRAVWPDPKPGMRAGAAE